MPRVSVIMNCRNGERYLGEAIESVFAQTFTDWEIVFWDNSSTDNSAEIAQSYGSKVRCFKSEGMLSLGEARNRAFSRAQGEFIAILDVDDVWLPEKLERQIKLFDDPDVGMVFTNAVSFDSRGEHFKTFRKTPTKQKTIFGDLLRRNFIWTVTMMFRRSALNRLPYLFDPDFSIVCDYDLTLRLANVCETDFIEDCLAKWRFHSDNRDSESSYQSAREAQVLLSRLEENIPEIKTQYADEIREFKMHEFRPLVKEAWLAGDRSKVRELLQEHWCRDSLSFFGYVGSWLIPTCLSSASIRLVQQVRHALRS